MAFNQANTYDQAEAIREDILDLIINISPEETPFFSSIGKGKAFQTRHEWVRDALAAPVSNNAQVEGFDASFAAPAVRTKDYNFTQIFADTVKVSGTSRAVNHVGIEDEFAYQMTKTMKEHARDIEKSLLSNTTRAAGDTTPTARTLGGLTVFIDGYATATTQDAWSGNTLYKGGATPKAFSEDEFNEAIQRAWEDGGMVDTVWCPPAIKRRISKFSAQQTRNIDASSKRLINAVDVYESDFGLVKIVPNRWITFTTTGDVYFLDSRYFKVAVLRPTKEKPLPESGDYTASLLVTELTLEGRAPAAHACIKAATAGLPA